MKGGTFDISEIKSADIFVKGSLSVRVKKLTSFVCLLAAILWVLFFSIFCINAKKYLLAGLMFVFSISSIVQMFVLYRFAISRSPYFVIENDGIVFKKKYYWNEIESIKIHRYLSVTWNEEMYINLMSEEKISIDLLPTFMSEETEVVAAYIKSIRHD